MDLATQPETIYMLKPCNHWRTEFKVGRYTVLASSYLALSNKNRVPRSSLLPSWGVYLDEGWKNVATSYPKLMIPWPDWGAIPLAQAVKLVQNIESKLQAGAVVEIGCYLGHGRTGTLLACLLVKLEKLKPGESIAEVRRRYCQLAIEVPEQVELIHEYFSTIQSTP